MPNARRHASAIEPGSIGSLVADVHDVLAAANVELARDEARDLVAALLDVPRFWPTLNVHEDASDVLTARALAAARTRARGAPFAYAVGRAAFRHLTLAVDERVLIPRQETELLVDLVLGAGLARGGIAVDVGTGSGAIALALATEGQFDEVIATDISRDALAVAAGNVERYGGALRGPVHLVSGASLVPCGGVRARAIVSNPPYIAYSELDHLPSSVRDWEPALALITGGDGLAVTRTIVREASAMLEPDGLLALEVDVRRAALVAELVAANGAYRDVRVDLDLTGRERFVLGRRR